MVNTQFRLLGAIYSESVMSVLLLGYIYSAVVFLFVVVQMMTFPVFGSQFSVIL